MDVATITRRVQRTFGDENEVVIHVDDVVDWINSGQVKIARETRCLQTDVDVAIDATNNGYPLPIDYISDDQATYKGQILRRTDIKYIQEVMGDINVLTNTMNSDPATMYYIYARKIWLYPWPKVVSSTNLHLWYTRLPIAVADSNDIPEIPVFMHEDLVTYCLSKANELNADYDQARAKQQELLGDIALSKSESQSQDTDSYPSVRNYDGDLW